MYDIPILMLHSVNDEPSKSPMGSLAVSSKGLEAYLKLFKQWHYQMISMDDLIEKRFDSNQPYVVLTFDDGYKDNLTVAMPILKKYGAKATIFVNPAYVSEKSDPSSDWGFMTWEEVQQAKESGVFDIQAHTMTHEFIFTSDKVIDYYTPDKFEKYYWLAWMLFPDSPRKWDSTAMKYRYMIPVGYPVFEHGRRLAAKKFMPSEEYVTALIEQYNTDKSKVDLSSIPHGGYETDEEFNAYAVWEVKNCKEILEQKVGGPVHTLCFPGGGYTQGVLSLAEETGYRCYMVSSSKRIGNNHDHIKAMYEGEFVGLNRTAFSLIHPGILKDHVWDYWVARLSLGAYQNNVMYTILKQILSTILHG